MVGAKGTESKRKTYLAAAGKRVGRSATGLHSLAELLCFRVEIGGASQETFHKKPQRIFSDTLSGLQVKAKRSGEPSRLRQAADSKER